MTAPFRFYRGQGSLGGAPSPDCRSEKTISPLCSKKAGPNRAAGLQCPAYRASEDKCCSVRAQVAADALTFLTPGMAAGRKDGRLFARRITLARHARDSYRFAWKSL
jgi:hypothetical protein